MIYLSVEIRDQKDKQGVEMEQCHFPRKVKVRKSTRKVMSVCFWGLVEPFSETCLQKVRQPLLHTVAHFWTRCKILWRKKCHCFHQKHLSHWKQCTCSLISYCSRGNQAVCLKFCSIFPVLPVSPEITLLYTEMKIHCMVSSFMTYYSDSLLGFHLPSPGVPQESLK